MSVTAWLQELRIRLSAAFLSKAPAYSSPIEPHTTPPVHLDCKGFYKEQPHSALLLHYTLLFLHVFFIPSSGR